MISFQDLLALPFPAAYERLTDPATWEGAGPSGRRTRGGKSESSPLPDETCDRSSIRAGLEEDGFHVLRPPWRADLGAAAARVQALEARGFPASFALMHADTWGLVRTLTDIVHSSISDKLVCNLDILSWLIDPTRGQAGFSPHRDRQPEDVASSFLTCPLTGAIIPKYLTFWVALRNATPVSSCLYMIPKRADPGYMAGDIDDVDPLERCLPSKESYQEIRAFPLPAGDAVCFSHRTLHWGSRGSAREAAREGPRVSLAVAFSTPDFEVPYLDMNNQDVPTVALRAALVAGQMICYHERFSFDSKSLNFFKKCFDLEADHFHISYRNKVCAEFIAAVKESALAKSFPSNPVMSSKSPEGPTASNKRLRPSAKVTADLSLNRKSKKRKSTVLPNDEKSMDSDEEALEAAMEQILDGDQKGDYFVGHDDYEDSDCD